MQCNVVQCGVVHTLQDSDREVSNSCDWVAGCSVLCGVGRHDFKVQNSVRNNSLFLCHTTSDSAVQREMVRDRSRHAI